MSYQFHEHNTYSDYSALQVFIIVDSSFYSCRLTEEQFSTLRFCILHEMVPQYVGCTKLKLQFALKVLYRVLWIDNETVSKIEIVPSNNFNTFSSFLSVK